MDIQNAFNYPTYQCPGGDPCESKLQCPRPILSVINDTINDSFFAPGSTILLITQSGVEDLKDQNAIYENIQQKQARILVFIPDIIIPCGMPWTDPRNQALITLAQISGGDFFILQSRDILNPIFIRYLPTIYYGSTVESITIGNCTNDEVAVNVESTKTVLSIVYFGTLPTVTITDPFNHTVYLPSLINSVISFYSIYENPSKGKYKIVGTSNKNDETCILSVHSSTAP